MAASRKRTVGRAARAVAAPLALPALLALGPARPSPLHAQSVRADPDTAAPAADPSDLRGSARAAQAAFERARVRLLPTTLQSWSSRCDEIVGRFCEWYDEGSWLPDPEDPEIGRLRDALLQQLDSVGALLPADGWVLGQRVWYRTEAGRWDEAARVAARCGGAAPWWCAALEGFALHGAGRYLAAEEAFERALTAMPPDQARRWRRPDRSAEGGVRGLLDEAEAFDREEGGGEHPDSLSRVLDRLWALADPLWLVPGNDRRTAHYARWTVSTLKDGARNPFGISWGRDLEELTLRLGWELWWERALGRDITTNNVIGHKHPQGREYLPDGDALRAPHRARAEAFLADKTRPRSLYAPDYAPVLLPMEGQVAVFPRGDRVAVVASTWLPSDTTLHARRGRVPPWMEAGAQAELPDRAGLFLAPVDDLSRVRAVEVEGDPPALVVEAPAGRYLLSAETWSPSARRAGRQRSGVAADTLPPDLPTLSDLLFVRPTGREPADLADVAPRVLPRARVTLQEPVAVVWEVGGLGFDTVVLGYRLSVEKEDGNLLRRAGRWLGLVGDPPGRTLEWEEPGPDTPRRVLREVALELPAVDPGRYRVLLEVGLPGRAPLRSRAVLEVTGPDGG